MEGKILITKRVKKSLMGFTLVETIIAIAILMIALISPMTATQKALLSAEYSRDQMKAYYLAEEALEYIRYVRDRNTLMGKNWLDGLGYCESSASSGKTCGINPLATDESKKIKECKKNELEKCALYFDNSTGLYSHDDSVGQESIFRRWAMIYNTDFNDQKKIEVHVDWFTGPLLRKEIVVVGYITDWEKQPVF